MNKAERKTILKALDYIIEARDNIELTKHVNIIRGIVAIDETVWAQASNRTMTLDHMEKLKAGRDKRLAIIKNMREAKADLKDVE